MHKLVSCLVLLCRSRSRNQKRRAVRSSENQTDGVGSRTIDYCWSHKQKLNNVRLWALRLVGFSQGRGRRLRNYPTKSDVTSGLNCAAHSNSPRTIPHSSFHKEKSNLVPRAHVPFGQHQDTELWNNQFPETKILGLPASRRMRGLV